MNKFKKTAIYISVILFATLSFLLISLSITTDNQKLVLDRENTPKQENHYIKISDQYDHKGHETVSSFINKEESSQYLKNFYHDILNSEILNYYEIAFQTFEFVGTCNLPESFVYGDMPELMNQEVIAENDRHFFVTPLKSVQAGKDTWFKLGLNYLISDEIRLDEEDFSLSDAIPLVLGYDYQGYLNTGDQMDAIFLTQKLRFVIKGFFKQGASIEFSNNAIPLDKLIAIPLFDLDSEMKNEIDTAFANILYSVKTTGYLAFTNCDSYTSSTKELSKLSKLHHLDYTFIPNDDLLAADKTGNYLKTTIAIIFSLFVQYMTLRWFLRLYLTQSQNKKGFTLIKHLFLLLFTYGTAVFASTCLSFYLFKYSQFFISYVQRLPVLIPVLVIYQLIILAIYTAILIRKRP